VSTAILLLTLIVPERAVAVGEPVPVRLELRNVSDHPVWVTGVLDGAEEGIRYPHCRPLVTREGEAVAAPPPPEDPLVSPLRLADFRLLQPGESFDPTRADGNAAYLPLFTFANFRPQEPGVYELSVTFSTASASPEEWLGAFGQDAERAAVLERIAEVPRLTLVAKAEVTVR
jgi:hypothetical protein